MFSLKAKKTLCGSSFHDRSGLLRAYCKIFGGGPDKEIGDTELEKKVLDEYHESFGDEKDTKGRQTKRNARFLSHASYRQTATAK